MTIPAASAEDCVRVVRSISDFTVQGDAWTWWAKSAGQYAHDNTPADGSVLVFKRSGRLGRGHVSLVSNVIDRRTIEVDHSWLGGRGLRRGMRVIDVSAQNDWSKVRVWHEPTGQLGMQVYPTFGFILPQGAKPKHLDQEPRYVVAPPGRSERNATKLVVARATPPAVRPGHKPLLTSGNSYAMQVVPDVVLPSRKPSRGVMVAAADGQPCPLPGRKPGALVQVAAKSE
ncbi:CHAP domain-containing protein [Azospirillum sp. sgz301742]